VHKSIFMKFFLSVLLAAFCSSACIAQTFTFNQGGTSASNYYQELPYENINGKLIVTVSVNGQKHRFLFDTGAPAAIDNALAMSANEPVITKILGRDAYGHQDSIPIVKIADIKLGDLDFKEIPAITLIPDFFKCFGIEGVIGSNMLRNSVVSIHDDKHVIIITDQPGKLNLDSKHSAPLSAKNGEQSDPIVTVKVGDKETVDLGFDTGDNGFLRIPEEMMNKLVKANVFKVIAKGFGANAAGEFGLQQNADKYRIKFTGINIGTANFANVITETSKQAVPGLGTKLLEYGSVTLDFINSKFYFDAKNEVNDLTEKQWPFSPALVGDQLIIGVVWGKAGDVKPGQHITAINGTDYSKVALCDMVTNRSILGGSEEAAITIKDDKDQVKIIRIKKQ
jgi:hypothetical protein